LSFIRQLPGVSGEKEFHHCCFTVNRIPLSRRGPDFVSPTPERHGFR
jgi:hypothetical protein